MNNRRSVLLITFFAGICALASSGCSNSMNRGAGQGLASGIIGGSQVQPSDEAASVVVMIANMESSGICTGTLISDELVLTAAHCLASSPAFLRIYFGVQPFSDSETPSRTVTATLTHEGFDGVVNTSITDDLALIRFSGGLPPGYAIADWAQAPTPVPDLAFTAIGLGRSDGRLAKQDLMNDGSGVLRKVDQTVAETWGSKNFLVSQINGQGVCSGDSGGPALIKNAGGWSVIGVASAVILTGEENGEQEESEEMDYCSQVAAYVSVDGYKEWIAQASAKILENAPSQDEASNGLGSIDQ